MEQPTIQQTFELAARHHQSGRVQMAETLYRQILAQDPLHAQATHGLGVAAHQMGRSDVAEELIRRAIGQKPDFAEAYSNLGSVLKAQGKLEEAISAYRQALALDANLPQAFGNLGNALKSKGDVDAAVVAYRRAIACRPDYADAHYNLATTLKGRGQFDEAVASYRAAIARRPAFAEAYNGLGNCLSDQGQLEAAIASYRQALLLKPGYADAHNNLGVVFNDLRRHDEAIAAFRSAISLNADYADAYNNLGNALKDTGQLDEAIVAYRRAIAAVPEDSVIHGNMVYASYFHSGYDAEGIAQEHRCWSRRHAEPLGEARGERVPEFNQPHSNNRDLERRLRIGYVSPDFRDHVVGQNLLPLLRSHDHSRFEITCYAAVLCPDAMTGRLREHADCWRSIVGLSDDQVADQIRADQIDVLVDLTLHMANNRLLVFARKPAPVQVTYLAYCGSSGMSAMDYRFSDPYLDPEGTDLSCYAETTLRLPTTYWCYEPGGIAPHPVPPPVMKNGFITFGCLNNFAKVSRASLDLWAMILMEVPKSRLMVHASPGMHRDDVTRRLERAGVTRDRLSFVDKQPWTLYMQRYSEIDIALDPFPYAGGITTCNALWMGVPVVTLSGETAVGRGGRSILTNLGMSELIAHSPEEYLRIAIELAKDPDRLNDLRSGLRTRMVASPLMDAKGFARDVETAYRRMWRTWCDLSPICNDGLAPSINR